MPNATQILSGFSFGEIDPLLAARVDFVGYPRGVKTANNVLSIPQGGFTGRFGTTYVDVLVTTNKDYAKLETFVYDDTAVYCLLFEHNTLKIYFENKLVYTVVTTYVKELVRRLRETVVQDRLVLFHQNYISAELKRSGDAPNAITGIDDPLDYITVTNALTIGNVYPVTFTTVGALPTSDPQIYINTIYYARVITATDVRIYATPKNAVNNTNYFTVTVTGVGNLIVQNTWTLGNIPFSNIPAFDFEWFSTYAVDGFTFTPNAVPGTTSIQSSIAFFTVEMIGGIFKGNGGVFRILTWTDNRNMTVRIINECNAAGAIPGKECYLGAPAWSATRGYPSCGNFFQDRLIMGGSRSIPHGTWCSTTSAVYDFDDSQKLADNAISYYSSSGSSNYVKAITATKSLLIHTNTGNYSTSLTSETALTPDNFFVTEQNTDGVSNVVPVKSDNQIMYVDRSANNLKTMMWDLERNSYSQTNISIPSSHLVKTPRDMDVFREPDFTDGYYTICVNDDGKLGIYNSLIEQDIKGWTKADTKQNATVFNVITGIDAVNEYIAVTDALTVGEVYPITFTTTGTLPITIPQIQIGTPYYINAITATNVRVYATSADATADINYFNIRITGTGNVILDNPGESGYFWDIATGLNRAWVIVERTIGAAQVLYLEELDFNVKTDCSVKYNLDAATATLTGLAHLNGQTVQVYADGAMHQDKVVAAGEIVLNETVSEAFVGLKFTSTITPLPFNMMLKTGPSLYQAIKIRAIQVHYHNSVGIEIQGYDIPTLSIPDIAATNITTPVSGVYEYTLMEPWDAFSYNINIVQEYPLPMTILGIGYNVEV